MALDQYGLPVVALVVSIIVLILTINQSRETQKIMKNDKEFMEWREKLRNNERKKNNYE